MAQVKKPALRTSETYTVTIHRDIETRIAVIEDWKMDGTPHREEGPAQISRDRVTGIVTREAWLKNNGLERDDGPAIIMRKPDTGAVFYSAWYRKGQKLPAQKPLRPAGRAASKKNVGPPAPKD